MSKRYIGADTETYDPLLKTAGYSWKYNQGYILCTSLHFADTEETMVVAGHHNDNCPFTKEQREKQNETVISILKNPNVCIVGANLQYDIGWLLYEYGMSTYEVKCSFVDVLQAESILNEFDIHNLEEVSWKYLRYGKRKTSIEEWVHNNVSAKGDFRQHLKDAPWDLLVDYVSGDAENPVNIWKKQLTLLKEQDLCSRAKLEFDCILPILQITMNGYPIDFEKKKENCKLLTEYRDQLKSEFEQKYGVKNFNVNSSRNIAELCDKLNIPYTCKITLKGENGAKFNDCKDIDNACVKAKKIISSFRFVKSVPVAYVPSTMAERSCELLSENGFMFTCSPNVDKKFFASQRDNYPVIATIADWKLCNGILSKILGEEFNRFISLDKDGQTRTHGQFSISNTATLRLSSNHNNMQQIPSKGGFKIVYKGKETEVSFPELTRALFTAEKGKVLIKADFSQEEQRLLAHYAVGEGSEEVRKAYNENPHLDFHQYVCDLTGLTRKYAKSMSFGITYGMSLKSMAENFGWTMEKAEEIAEAYHSKMPFVNPTFSLVKDVMAQRGYIKTICGARARLSNPNKAFTALNRICQGGGADILKSAVVRAFKEGLWERIDVKNTIHDEINFCVPPTEEGVLDTFRMTSIMTDTIKLRVPLICEPEIGTDWVHVKEIPEWIELKNSNSSEWADTSQEVRDYVIVAERLLKEGRIKL